MALDSRISGLLCRMRSISLVLLSAIFLPLSISIITIATLGRITGFVSDAPSAQPLQDGSPKRVLITGVGMAKGLFLARTMHIGGCTVIGADFDHHGSLHCGRFSRAVHRFYALRSPSVAGIEMYINQVLDLIRRENIALWISCSGVATAIEDAVLAEAIEERTACKAFQLNQQAISILDDKLNFMRTTSKLGLTSLQWHALSSPRDVNNLLQRLQLSDFKHETKYIIKSAGMDDATRGALPILTTHALDQMQDVLSQLDFRENKSWILQEFVESGEEYCTQGVVVNNKVVAFTACKSESVLMHYTQLDPKSILFKKMLRFTQDYIQGLSKETGQLTGHMSFDFLIKYQETKSGYEGILAPIECNPRCHTATVLFRSMEDRLSRCYLSTLQHEKSMRPLVGNDDVHPGFYWMAHDLVVLIVNPFIAMTQLPSATSLLWSIQQSSEGFLHLLYWKDPTFEWWDPLPWFVLNHLYWPVELFLGAFSGARWKQLNVSTTKMFRC